MPQFRARACWHAGVAPQPLHQVPPDEFSSGGIQFHRKWQKSREKLTQRHECDQKPIASRVLSSIHCATNKTLAGKW